MFTSRPFLRHDYSDDSIILEICTAFSQFLKDPSEKSWFLAKNNALSLLEKQPRYQSIRTQRDDIKHCRIEDGYTLDTLAQELQYYELRALDDMTNNNTHLEQITPYDLSVPLLRRQLSIWNTTSDSHGSPLTLAMRALEKYQFVQNPMQKSRL